jgi:hypothetical protein
MSQFDDYSGSSQRAPQKISAESFVATLAANVNNPKMSAEAFREFVRTTLPIVNYPHAVESAVRQVSSSQFDDSFPVR